MNAPDHHVLIIGTGSIGERHLRCFLKSGRAQVSFVEVRDDLAQAISERYPDATRRASIVDAVQAGCNVAVVATPAPLHIPLAEDCVNAGLAVLIEKPLSIGLAGTAELQQLATQSNTLVGVAYVYRAHPALTELRDVLQSGRLGKPLQLVSVSGQNFPTYRPAYRQTYYTRHETGGGAVQDALTHALNAGEWLLGGIREVVSDFEHLALEGVDVEDTVHVLARHGSGVMASYSLNQHQAPNEMTMTVICQRGTLRFEYHQSRWRMMETPDAPWQDSPPVMLERDTLFVRQADAFLDAVEGRAAPLCSLADGLSTLRANLAILKSRQRHAWQSTDPQELSE